jgi:hypothetical protein
MATKTISNGILAQQFERQHPPPANKPRYGHRQNA